jgi:hypothetical protein
MNSRQLTLILLIAIVVGAIGWFLFHRGARSWETQPTAGDGKVIQFPLNDVAQITIKDGSGEVNLVRKADLWVVRERADYPANFEQVSRFLQKVWNLKPVQTLQVGPSQLARFDLVEPAKDAKNSGTLLQLKNKDEKQVAALLAGKQYLKKSTQSFGRGEFPAGRYVMPEKDSKRVSLLSDPLQDLVTKPERWLNKDFIKIEKPKTIALAGATPAQQWKLVRENESAVWKFADAKAGEELDNAKAQPLASSVSSLSFTDVLDPQTNLDHPSTVTIETVDGFVYTLKIGQLKGESYPVTVSVEAQPPAPASPAPNEKPEEQKKTREEKLAKEKKFEGRPFLVSKFSVEQLLKDRADLIKAAPSASPSPSGQPKIPVLPPARPGAKPLPTSKGKP